MLLINGKWTDSETHLDVVSPVDGRKLGTVGVAGAKEVGSSVAAARKALQNPLASFDRSQLLRKAYEGLGKNRADLAKLMTQETGKLLRECEQEIDRGLTTILWSAEEALRFYGETLPCDITDQRFPMQAMTVRVPLGILGAITPFNFPVNLPLHKIAPALAAGNAVILKPSPKTPLSANRLLEIFQDSGWPAGWLSCLHGDVDTVKALVTSDIDAVSLTAGMVAGREVSKLVGSKRLLLELGGNDPIILDKDADVTSLLPTLIQQRFGSSGQRCTSCKRLFVHESLLSSLLSLLEKKVAALKVGDPFEASTDLGPLINEAAAIKVENQVKGLQKEGAKLHCGGTRKSNYFSPTLLSGGNPLGETALEEIFGPVLPVYSYKNLEEVVMWINSSSAGLQAGVFTRNLDTIKYLFSRLDVGTLLVNQGPSFRIESFPFGGMKKSGLGREGIRYTMHELSTIKTLIL